MASYRRRSPTPGRQERTSPSSAATASVPRWSPRALKVLDAVTAGSGTMVAHHRVRPRRARWHATGETLPDSVLEEIRGHDAILLGAVGDPERAQRRPRARAAAPAAVRARPLRQPAPGAAVPRRRGPLAEAGSRRTASTSSSSARAPRGRTSATAARCASARRTRSPPRSASTPRSASSGSSGTRSRRAQARPRKKLTLVHKHNVLVPRRPPLAAHRRRGRRGVPGGRRRLPARRRGDDLPGHRPGRFDVIVTDNLFGDILTDLAAAITGGIGLAASGNINPDRTAPEHVRAGARLGAGHRRAGQGRPDRRDPVGRACCSSTWACAEAAARVERGRRGGHRRARRPPPRRPPRSATRSRAACWLTGRTDGRLPESSAGQVSQQRGRRRPRTRHARRPPHDQSTPR